MNDAECKKVQVTRTDLISIDSDVYQHKHFYEYRTWKDFEGFKILLDID